ncbi:MAG: hypothetical protein ACWA5K_01295 [bacterium]
MNEKNTSAKWQLGIMIGMVLFVIVAGFLVFPRSDEDRAALLERLGTTNHGTLLESPQLLAELTLKDAQAINFDLAEEKPKWRMVLLGDGNCSRGCAEMLALTHSVHLLLGRNSHRFERLLLVPQLPLAPSVAEDLGTHHPYLNVLSVDPQSLDAWLNKAELSYTPGDALALLVDQNGLAMMAYSSEQTGGEMLEDLKHLLRFSPGN